MCYVLYLHALILIFFANKVHNCFSENIISSEVVVLLALREFDNKRDGSFVSGGHVSIILTIRISKIMTHIYFIQHIIHEGNILG